MATSGLISTAAPKFEISPTEKSTDWNVDPKTQTVAGQLSSVIASNSPLMQQARTRATQSMNGRGLVNSSMATGAADSAMYDAAMPIAQADASTYANAGKYNADTANQFTAQRNANRFAADTANFNLAGNDWTAQQDFGRQTQRDATQQGYTQENARLASDLELGRMGKAQEYSLQTLGQQQGFQGSQAALDRAQQTSVLDKQQTFQGGQAALDRTQATTLADKQIAAQKDIVNTQTTAARDVAEMEATYKTITQGSSAATSIMSNMQNALNLLAANKDITDPAKRTALEAQIKKNAKDSLEMIGALAGDADIAKYLDEV